MKRVDGNNPLRDSINIMLYQADSCLAAPGKQKAAYTTCHRPSGRCPSYSGKFIMVGGVNLQWLELKTFTIKLPYQFSVALYIALYIPAILAILFWYSTTCKYLTACMSIWHTTGGGLGCNFYFYFWVSVLT